MRLYISTKLHRAGCKCERVFRDPKASERMAPSSTSLSSKTARIITSIFIISTSLPSASTTAIPNSPPFKKMYAFGDSYTDTGNTRSTTGPSGFNYVSNLPYGKTFFHHPTNRYSDGRLMIDFVAEALSLPYLPPYQDQKANKSAGVNFAVAGSTAIGYSFFVANNLTLDITPQSLGTQLSWFNKYLEDQGCSGATRSSQCDATLSDALFWVGEIGANDYAYTIGSSVSSSTIQKFAISSVTGVLQALLTKGAKYVVVQGLPTTGCLPLAMALAPVDDRDDLGCVASANKQASSHNAVLQLKLQELRKRYPRAAIVYADFWNAYRAVMKNAGKYGFREPFRSCCGSGGGPYNFDVSNACGSPPSSSCPNPSQYINWDGVHLTEAMYKVVIDLLLNGTFSRPPFQYLLSRKKQAAGMY